MPTRLPLPRLNELLLAAAALILDQTSKAAALAAAPSSAHLTVFWHARPPLYATLTIASTVALSLGLYRLPALRQPGAYLMLGGGLSNLLDLARYRSILDIISIGRAQLNVADMLVIAGAAQVVFTLLRSYHSQPARQRTRITKP